MLYYNGDGAPNLVVPKHVDPALGPGYDYDVCNSEVLLTRVSVRDGRLVLPDGMSYRILVLPDRRCMPLEILQKVTQLVEAGATVVGQRPEKDPGLRNYPQCDEQVRELASNLWGECDGTRVKQRRVGQGRIVWGRSLREVLGENGVAPDFEVGGHDESTFLDFIHRRDGEADIYFVVNRLDRDEAVRCIFRVSGRQPELWDPVSGVMREAPAFTQDGGRTTVPLEFAPYGSIFVVFRKAIPQDRRGEAAGNSPQLSRPVELPLAWTVKFVRRWGGPESIRFEKLYDWTKSDLDGIKYYSGTATYQSEKFPLPADLAGQSPSAIYLDLGEVRTVARVRLNGTDLGVLWTRPFRVEITRAVQPADNLLEITVTNLWPNRLIGDAALPAEQRFTRTHVTKFTKDMALLPSGLLGPVRLMMAQ